MGTLMAVITILVTSILQIKDLLPIVNFMYLAVSICLFILHQLFYLYQYFVSSVVIRNLIVIISNRVRKHKHIGMESIACLMGEGVYSSQDLHQSLGSFVYKFFLCRMKMFLALNILWFELTLKSMELKPF